MNPNNTTLFRKEGQSQVVDAQGNLQSFGGNLDTLPIYKQQNNVITSDALTPKTKIDLSGIYPNQQTGDGLVNSVTDSTKAFDTEAAYQKELELQKLTKPDSTQLDTYLNNLLDAEQGLTGRGAEQTQAEINAGIPEANKARSSIQGQIKTQIAEYNAMKAERDQIIADIEAGAGRKGLTTGAVLGQQGAQERQYLARLNSKAAEIGILQAQDEALKGDIDTAQKNVDRAIDLKYQDREAEYTAWKNAYDRVKGTFDEEEKKRGEALAEAKKKEEEALKEKKEEEKNIQNIALKIAENGGDPNIVSKAKTTMEALGLAKNALQKKDVELREINGALYAVDKNTLKVKYIGGGTATGGTGKGVSGAYGDVINTIIGSGKFTKDQANAIRNSISNGEEPFVVVKNQAKGLMTGANQTKVENYETAQKALGDIQSQLKQYYANGGSTNIFKGNYEKVVNNLGNVSDPKLVDLAVQIQTSLQVYRNAVSGTAYSVQEGKDIASIFPGINKTQGLNEAILSGRMKAFESTIDGAYEGVLGQKTYQSMKNLTTNQAKGNLSDKDFVEKALVSNGINYEKMVNDASKYPGQIPVIDNATGQAGWIPFQEFNSSKYTKI